MTLIKFPEKAIKDKYLTRYAYVAICNQLAENYTRKELATAIGSGASFISNLLNLKNPATFTPVTKAGETNIRNLAKLLKIKEDKLFGEKNWRLERYELEQSQQRTLDFKSKDKALNFEKYLKTEVCLCAKYFDKGKDEAQKKSGYPFCTECFYRIPKPLQSVLYVKDDIELRYAATCAAVIYLKRAFNIDKKMKDGSGLGNSQDK